jgi:hypothetical protein
LLIWVGHIEGVSINQLLKFRCTCALPNKPEGNDRRQFAIKSTKRHAVL